MGDRGPAPTPAAILKMRGSWRAKGRTGGIQPKTEIPLCPKWINNRARQAWKYIVPILNSLKVTTKLDRGAITRYCTTYAHWQECEEFLDKHGKAYTVKNPDGTPKGVEVFPQVAMAQKYSEILGKLEQQFGLTPSARTRIQVGVTKERDEKAEKKSKYFSDAV